MQVRNSDHTGCVARGWNSVVGIATTLRAGHSGGRNPLGGEIFHTRPDLPWGNGYRVFFPGVKRLGHGVDHPTHLAPRLKKE